MNPQYMQQQRPSYGPPASNSTYGELNANLPSNGLQDSQSFPHQKQPVGSLPTSNVPSAARPPYYVNDVQGKADVNQGPPFQQTNQNNLVDQMSNIALSGLPRPPPSQNYASQEKTVPSMPFLPSMNGINNQNHHSSPGENNGLTHQELQSHNTLQHGLAEGSQLSRHQLTPNCQPGSDTPKIMPPSVSSVNQQGPHEHNFSSYGFTQIPKLAGPPMPPSSSQLRSNTPKTTPPSASPVHQQGPQGYNVLSEQRLSPDSQPGPNIPKVTSPSLSPINSQRQNKSEIFLPNQADSTRKSPGVNPNSHLPFRGSLPGSMTSPPAIGSSGLNSGSYTEALSAPITGTITSQASSLPSPYGSVGGSQFSAQIPAPPLSSLLGSSIQKTSTQPTSPTNHHRHIPGQNRSQLISPTQADLIGKPPPMSSSTQTPFTASSAGLTSTAKTPSVPPSNVLWGSPLEPNSLNSTSQSVPPVSNFNQVLGQNISETASSGQVDYNDEPPGIPLKGPPSTGHSQGTLLTQPPLGPSPYSLSNSHSLNRPSLSGIPGHNPPPMAQQNLSRPPLLGQSSNLSGPPLSGHQSMPGQQSLHSQYHYGNQIPEQRRYSPNPSSTSHQQNAFNSYGHSNQLSDTSYSQQYYGQTYQNNVYASQTSPYNSPVTSPTSGYQSSQSQQARRLDPEQMPSPIQVIQDDQRTKGGVFATNQKGLVPPLVTTKFTVDDQGNASPRFIRSSMYTVPTTVDIIKQTQVPFSLILSPMAQVEEGEMEPPIVDMGELGPVRCHRCKAYMNPFMQFLDAGRRFQCVFCKATTEVPNEYFQHLDHTGYRLDRLQRPELMLGTYEFIATKDYCRNNSFPKPPAVIFVIDVSYNTIKSGLIHLLCSQMKKIIRNLPVDVGQTKSNMKVGFITYSNIVHFYNLKPNLAQPQMMVVGDVQDVFMPLLDGFLCDPEESEVLIDSLMSQIPTMFGDTRDTEIILAPAIQAGLEALKASECAGKLMVFHSSLPTAEAPGKLKNRDDRKLLGTDKEKNVTAPQTNFYNNLGQECVGSGCSVDLFIFNNSYVDVATIGQVSRLTGGEVYKYTYFQADLDGDRLIMDIMNNLNRSVAYDAVMRVRTSTGIRPVDFYGHFYMSNTTDIELATIDSDKAVAVEIKHDDKLTEEEGVFIQAALLYTSCSGVRRLRVINLSLKTSSQMSELYRACDLDAIINYLSKQSVFKVVEQPSKVIKDNLHARCAAILASYRKHCASPSSAGQLILPECMKLLPLYINGLVKSDAITGGGGITVDQKAFVMMVVATMPISESIVHVYPRLLPLHDVDPQESCLPPMLRCSADKFTDDGAYLLENGMHMFLWLGSSLCSQWVQSVFGVSSIIQVDTDKTTIPPLDNPLNRRIRTIISNVQSERRYSMRLTLTKQKDKMEMVMRQFLVEDRGSDSSPGYVDFLCHMHREIRTLLS